MADSNQTAARGNWICPCNGCSKAVAFERVQLVELLEQIKKEYQEYRGSSFDKNGNVLWMKDDVEAYSDGIDNAINLIKNRTIKKK